ncbi:MAG TPA: glycosyltransferase family 4 protein [Candidatus Bariatricus faecipullorum]|nr:glycosyltransferase family 4 protein [Candidatus Bariatricus faecipullorum]
MLGHKRIPSREGGIEIVVEELSTRMVRLGHKVTCYNRAGHHVSGKKYDKGRQKQYKGVRLKTVPTVTIKGLAAMTASVTAAFAAAFGKYDVVHFHAEGPSFMCWLPKLFGKRVIVTVHGLDHQRAKWGKLASTYIMLGEKNAVRFADEIIVLSEGVRQYFLDTYGRNTCFIPNGVSRPVKREADVIRQNWGLEKDQYLLYLGRIVPEKGISYLIEAFHQTDTGKKMVIAGGSSDTEEYLKELKEKASDDNRILFTGFVQGRVLEELYSNAYLYILPSNLEGMPLSLLEAMSYGNCCVVSDIAECTEVVEDKAAVFPKGDVPELWKILQKLCNEPETVESYRKEAADYICGKYNWDEVTRKTLELYR